MDSIRWISNGDSSGLFSCFCVFVFCFSTILNNTDFFDVVNPYPDMILRLPTSVWAPINQFLQFTYQTKSTYFGSYTKANTTYATTAFSSSEESGICIHWVEVAEPSWKLQLDLIRVCSIEKMSDATQLAEELLSLLNANESGLSDEQISTHFGPRYGELVHILNDLLSMNRLQLFTQGGVLIYRLIREETAAKFEGLGWVLFPLLSHPSWFRSIDVLTLFTSQLCARRFSILRQHPVFDISYFLLYSYLCSSP